MGFLRENARSRNSLENFSREIDMVKNRCYRIEKSQEFDDFVFLGEGKYPVFDRDEIKNFQAVPEQRVIAIIPEKFELNNAKSRGRSRSRSRSPMDYYNRMHTNEPRKSVYKRLGPRKSRYDSSGDEPEAETKVDAEDNDRVLDREELESRRPQVKPWEINPEYVPKRGYYFEHDNREGDQPSYGGRGGYNRGRGRGRGRGGRGTYNNHFFKRKTDIL